MTRRGGEAAREGGSRTVELTGIENRDCGGVVRRGGRVIRQRVKEWGQAKPRRLGGAPIGGAGSRWAGKPAAAAPAQSPGKLEVGDDWEDWFAICEKFRGLIVN